MRKFFVVFLNQNYILTDLEPFLKHFKRIYVRKDDTNENPAIRYQPEFCSVYGQPLENFP